MAVSQITLSAMKALMHLKKQGHSKLAEKLFGAITTGKPLSLTSKERVAFLPVRGELTGTKGLVNPIQNFKNFQLRNELGFHPFGGNLIRKSGEFKGAGQGAYHRSIYGSQKKVPMSDVDLRDPFSHAGDQVIHNTLDDFIPAFKDYMKTKRGKQSAFKLYRTPAGLRLFDVSKIGRNEKPLVYQEVWNAIGGDPRYRDMALRSGSYAARLHPKIRKHNIWNLKGNVRTGKFAKENPGDFVAQQKIPGSIIKGPDAIIDPRSLSEVKAYHDGLVKLVLQNKLKTGNISLDGLLKYIDMTTL